MAYYYDQDGNKIPVDDHSPQDAKNAAAAQEAQDLSPKQGATKGNLRLDPTVRK
jgi:hypothetical protein